MSAHEREDDEHAREDDGKEEEHNDIFDNVKDNDDDDEEEDVDDSGGEACDPEDLTMAFALEILQPNSAADGDGDSDGHDDDLLSPNVKSTQTTSGFNFSQDAWNHAYTVHNSATYDWFGAWDRAPALRRCVEQAWKLCVLTLTEPENNKHSILLVGCGNSPMAEHMLLPGPFQFSAAAATPGSPFKDALASPLESPINFEIVGMDYVSSVVDQMQRRAETLGLSFRSDALFSSSSGPSSTSSADATTGRTVADDQQDCALLRYVQADATDLAASGLPEFASDGSGTQFSLIIDKGTLDAVICSESSAPAASLISAKAGDDGDCDGTGDTEDAKDAAEPGSFAPATKTPADSSAPDDAANAMLKELIRVVDPRGGIVMIITYGPPETRLPYFERALQESGMNPKGSIVHEVLWPGMHAYRISPQKIEHSSE